MSITSKTDVPITYLPNIRPMTNDMIIGAVAATASYALREKVNPLVSLPLLFLSGEWTTWYVLGRSTRFSQVFYEAPDLILDSGTFNSNVQLVHKTIPGQVPYAPVHLPPPDYSTPTPYKFHASALG